jgi:hemolysin III
VAADLQAQRPVLRGWSHAIAVIPAVAGATALVVAARNDLAKQASLIVYGLGLTLLFAVSALYHRGRWSPRVRAVWRRADHATIFVMIAATYTPVAATLLTGWPRVALLAAVWTLAVTGAVLVATPVTLPRYVLVLLYIAVGWTVVFAIPALAANLGPDGMAYLVAGGALYTTGAVMYALQRPRLWPRVFGYHEVFHLLVIAATAVFFAFIAGRIVPAVHV